MNGSQLLKKAFKDLGIKHVFGYTGGAIIPFFDEANRGDNIVKIIQTRNEQGAAFMAQGVSRASYSLPKKEIGVCLSTSGPGAMNLVTGVADAYMDSAAMISISGQVASALIGSDAFQETDVVGVMIPITKQVYMPTCPEEIESTFHEAYFLASNGRPGPVHIDIPKDVQGKEADANYRFSKEGLNLEIYENKINIEPDPTLLAQALNLINKSERPVILCGHGVRISNAGNELLKFARSINAPITSTLHGLSAFPSDDPLHLGMMGMHGTAEANRAIQNADLIIAFGMRFDDRVTGKIDEYAKNADVIHVEIDASEIDKNIKTTIGIKADVLATIKKLNKSDLVRKPRTDWFSAIEQYRSETSDWEEEDLKRGTGKEGRILMKRVIRDLSRMTDGKDILVMDVGQHQMLSNRYYTFKTPNSSFNSGGAGTMGASIPMAIGVKQVRSDEVVWSISGDGGFQMNIQELGTIMEHEVDIKIIILNNRFLGMVRQWQTLFYKSNYSGTPMLDPDFGKIASAYNIPYSKVTKPEEIEENLVKARNHKGAYILEFECDASEIVFPMIPAGKPFSEMIVNPEDIKS